VVGVKKTARPKSGRLYKTILRREGFVVAVPFRDFRDGTGIFRITVTRTSKARSEKREEQLWLKQ
jgi:hypothetical protein